MANKRIKDLETAITAFRTGDVIPVDGPSGTAKMSKDDLLARTAENALAGNVAQVFDPTKPNDDGGYAYYKDEIVTYQGAIYRFKMNHSSGAWNSAEVEHYTTGESLRFLIVADNPEYPYALIDSEGRFIFGVAVDGSVEWAKGIPEPIKDELALKVSKVVGKSLINETFASSAEETNDSLFSYAFIDSDGRLIAGFKKDGTFFVAKLENAVIERFQEVLGVNFENPVFSSIVVAGKYNGSEDNPEYFSATLDKEKRILESTSIEDGKFVIHHHEKHIFDDVVLGGYEIKEMSDLANALKNSGFTGGQGDWSDEKELAIAEPRCAVINFIVDSLPVTKTANKQAIMQFWDLNGNYFKKRVILNAQGQSSLSFPKKNFSIDICNDEWIGDDTFKLSIGSWVAQDSFHLKAFYNDGTKSLGAVAYKIFEKVASTYAIESNRTYKRTYTENYTSSGNLGVDVYKDFSHNYDDGAKCFPDMFPCIVFHNGNFHGCYSFALKKHRDNYWMKKNEVKHIHLDIGNSIPFRNDTIAWSQFEIRNPKNLYYNEPHLIDGELTLKYDGEHPYEIMGEDSEYFGKNVDGTAADAKTLREHQNCSEVKNYIVQANVDWKAIVSYASENPDNNAEIRSMISDLFDVDSLIDYNVLTMVLGNLDSWNRNVQFTTWDGIKWAANPYDWDTWCGGGLQPFARPAQPFKYWGVDYIGEVPYKYIHKYFYAEEKARFELFKNKKILDADEIVKMISDYMARFGKEFFDKEYKKWSESPCNRDSKINADYWKLVDQGNSSSTSKNYDDTRTYDVGERCTYGDIRGWTFECVAQCSGQPPLTAFYQSYPQELGYHESIYRIKNFLTEIISFFTTQYI